jgi:hypothetical protein
VGADLLTSLHTSASSEGRRAGWPSGSRSSKGLGHRISAASQGLDPVGLFIRTSDGSDGIPICATEARWERFVVFGSREGLGKLLGRLPALGLADGAMRQAHHIRVRGPSTGKKQTQMHLHQMRCVRRALKTAGTPDGAAADGSSSCERGSGGTARPKGARALVHRHAPCQTAPIFRCLRVGGVQNGSWCAPQSLAACNKPLRRRLARVPTEISTAMSFGAMFSPNIRSRSGRSGSRRLSEVRSRSPRGLGP